MGIHVRFGARHEEGPRLMQRMKAGEIDIATIHNIDGAGFGKQQTVGNLLVPGNNAPWQEVRDTLNRSLLGWSNYFCHGTRRSAFRGIDRYVYERVRDFLARRHKVAGRGTHRFSCEVVYGERGLLRLERLPLTAPLSASR